MNPGGAQRHEFASDNTASICPEALSALHEANTGAAASYGDDSWTAQLRDRVREIFEIDCETFLAFNGTAANALTLAQFCQPFNSIICHERAHIETDECGAPEFFAGSKLLLVSGAGGKIDISAAQNAIARQPELHAPKPSLVSVTQATEHGRVYTVEELQALGDFARKKSLFVHMDGARFANAVAFLGCAPKEITWQAGVDVLCFGGTKNGLAAGELIVFFRKELCRGFDYRLKQGGQLGSKTRFLAAPWLALLTDDLWLRNAHHANSAARQLAERLRSTAQVEVVFPVEANSVFVRMHSGLASRLNERGWHFYKFVEPDVYRFMSSWATKDGDIAEFALDLERSVAEP